MSKIGELIKQQESENLEFKNNWRDEYLKTLSAFANSKGGRLILGTDDKRNIIGIDNWERLLEEIPSKIRGKLGLTPSVKCAEISGREIIIVEIKPSQIPISYNGKYYRRSGSTTVEMSGSELAHFLILKFGKTWDALPSDANFKDIDMSIVKLFKNLARKRIPGISDIDSAEKVFTNLELITEDRKITRAGLLLFGKEHHRFFISTKTRVGRFKTSTTILDTVIAEGNLFNQLERIVEAIKKHLSVRFEIKGIERRDVWDYPIEALREAVINALIHKDYLSTAEIQIKIYDDKIWMWNPGKLPEQLSIEDLKKEHSSYPRNPLIANVFYLAGFIERWGSGTKRIVDLCNEQDLPEPDYREEQGGFSVWFYKDIYTEENLRKMELNERQLKAVMYVKEKGKITNKEYQKVCNTSERTATRDLVDLLDKGLFKKRGVTGKGVEYSLKAPQRSQRRQKDVKKTTFRYYCKIPGNEEIEILLQGIKDKYNIEYEIIERPYDKRKDKQVYERYFKPRAKILKRRTGIPITKLRSHRARNYFVSIPGTLAVFRNDLVEWWSYTDTEIINLLRKIISEGIPFLEKLLSR